MKRDKLITKLEMRRWK